MNGGRAVAVRTVNGHIVIPPASPAAPGENVVDIAFRAGDAPLNRNPEFLYSLFVPARAHLAFPCFDQPDLEGALHARARRCRRAGRRSPTAPSVARDVQGDAPPDPLRGNPADPDVPVRVRRRHVPGRDRGTRRPDVPDAPPRDRREEGRAESRRRLRPSRRRRWRGSSSTPASRIGSASSTSSSRPSFQFSGMEHPGAIFYNASSILLDEIGDREPDARPREPHRARDGAHVVRRPGDDAVVQRRVDEGGVRQLHGGEDREPGVSEGQPRAAVPDGALPRRVRRRSHRGHASHPAGARRT